MNTFLRKLQNKSDAEKAFFALTVSIIVTVFLFATWGYTVAHSGNLNTIANGATNSVASVATVVDDSGIIAEFSRAFEQFRSLSGDVDNASTGSDVGDTSVSGRYINVFATPNSVSSDGPVPGENPADVLY